MSSSSRICVSGAGVVSAIGIGKEATLHSLRSLTSGIAPLEHLCGNVPDLVCGEVKASNHVLSSLAGVDVFMPRTSLLGTVALAEALKDADLYDYKDVALISATTVGGMDETEKYYPHVSSTLASRIMLHDCGKTTDAMACVFGKFAMCTTVSTACSAALNSIIYGCRLIRSGRFDIVVAGGTEALSSYHVNGFNSLKILDPSRCRPFDRDRNGLNLGEGAGFVVLESEESVRRRRVFPYAVLSGYGNACDAYHQTASSPDGTGAFAAMSMALKMACLVPSDIDYVNAHGTGTVNNDLSEGIALQRIFGADSVPAVSSTKAFTGHTTSASGAVESVISLLALREGFFPVSLGFSERIEGLSFDPVTDGDVHGSISRVMVNAFGFGGNDSSVIFEKI